MVRRGIGLDGSGEGWSIGACIPHGPGYMTAASPRKTSPLAYLPLWLVLAAVVCAPLDAHAVDARSARASLSLTSRGVEAVAQGNLARAQQLLEEAMVSDPANVRAITQLGIVHEVRGSTKLARKYYLMALSVDPVDPDALSRLAHLDLAEGGRARAEENLSKLRASCSSCRQTQELARALDANTGNQAPLPDKSPQSVDGP